MSTRSNPPIFPGEMPPAEALSSLARFRESVAESLFYLSRTYPKLLTLRSTPRAWTLFRFVLGTAGAALVVLPLSLWNAWAFAPVGLVLFLVAVLLPPLRHDPGTAQAMAQLGAYRVLDGGRYSSATEGVMPVNLFLAQSRVWALDHTLRPLVVIPSDEIVLAAAFPLQNDWILRIGWKENSAEFIFDGLFAERRARSAEAGLRHLVQPKAIESEPSRARAKAAGA
jgi:hypothetical protein